MPVEKNKSLIKKSFLQTGNNLPLTTKYSFKHPTIGDVLAIDSIHNGIYSEDIYYSMINIFLTDPYLYMVYLDDHGMDYEKITAYELFLLLLKDYYKNIENVKEKNDKVQYEFLLKNNIYFQAFNFFIGIDSFYIAICEGNEVIANDNHLVINSEIYEYIYQFVKMMNGIQDGIRINPADDFAKKILIADERERIKKQTSKKNVDNKSNDRLGNLISSVTWGCNGGISPFNRNELHIYDLIEAVERTDKVLKYKYTMSAIQSGFVDTKKIDFEELRWFS
jgi:hypothetical protein